MLPTIFTWAIVLGGGILLTQLALMFLGGDDGGLGDLDVDLGGDAHSHGHGGGWWFFEIFSLRTLSAAALFFGLVGMALLSNGMHPTQAATGAGVAGAAALYAVYWLFRQVFRLQSSGTENIAGALGLEATTYVAIPAARSGAGKVQVGLQGRTVEYQALTDQSQTIASGQPVTIVEILGPDTVLVRRG